MRAHRLSQNGYGRPNDDDDDDDNYGSVNDDDGSGEGDDEVPDAHGGPRRDGTTTDTSEAKSKTHRFCFWRMTTTMTTMTTRVRDWRPGRNPVRETRGLGPWRGSKTKSQPAKAK